MPKGSKVAKAERAIKSSVKKAHPGYSAKQVNNETYATLNKIGLKHGSKTTARGRSPAKNG